MRNAELMVAALRIYNNALYGKVLFPRGDRYIGNVSGRLGSRPLRKGLFSFITTI